MKTNEKGKKKKSSPRSRDQYRKDLFTWTHRYLRLHSELLEDEFYKSMFDYHRKTLAAYLKKELKNTSMNDEQLCDLIDSLADLFNKTASERVNEFKPIVEELYQFWKETADTPREISI